MLYYSVSYRVLINGHPLKPFSAKEGLRQGDPMSSYLLPLAMEYFTRCFAYLGSDRKFKYHPKCKSTKTIDLLFADDLLIFCYGNFVSVSSIKKQLKRLSKSSRLCANLNKSALYTTSVSEDM